MINVLWKKTLQELPRLANKWYMANMVNNRHFLILEIHFINFFIFENEFLMRNFFDIRKIVFKIR